MRCYLRLSDNIRHHPPLSHKHAPHISFFADIFQAFPPHTLLTRAREALRQCLPDPLRDNSFMEELKVRHTRQGWWSYLTIFAVKKYFAPTEFLLIMQKVQVQSFVSPHPPNKDDVTTKQWLTQLLRYLYAISPLSLCFFSFFASLPFSDSSAMSTSSLDPDAAYLPF